MINKRIIEFYINQGLLGEKGYLPMFYVPSNGQKVLSIGLNPSMPENIKNFLEKYNLKVKGFKDLSDNEQISKIDEVIAYQRLLKYEDGGKKKMRYFIELDKFFKELQYEGFNDFQEDVYHYDLYQKRNTASREVKIDLRDKKLVTELINQFKLVIDEVKPKIIFVFNAYVSDLLKRDGDFLKEAKIDDELGCHLYNDIPIVLANQLSGGATSIVYRDILIWNTKRILNKIKSKQ